MTVIAWDGQTLAADKMSTHYDLKMKVTKIRKINGHLVFASGRNSQIQALYDWYENGAKPENWPKFTEQEDFHTFLCIITPDKKILKYETTPYPFEIEEKRYAVGSGRDYAIAAMYMGASAKEAVKVASKFCANCGLGVDTLELDE